jgi:hypothetical protein
MFIIKKSTINYFYAYHIKLILYKYTVIAFFSFFNISQSNLNKFICLCLQNSLKHYNILGKFISFLFKDFTFFNFLKNFFIIVYSNSLNGLVDFYNELLKTEENAILSALVVNGFFLNLFLFDFKQINYLNLKQGITSYKLESIYVIIIMLINLNILCISL